MAEKNVLHDFVQIGDQIGIIVANETAGGVFRGHADVWFGEYDDDGQPIVLQLLVQKHWELVKRPAGQTPVDGMAKYYRKTDAKSNT